MATDNPSPISSVINGDFHCKAGQLGRTLIDPALAASGNLWTLYPTQDNRFLINGGVANRTLTLPVIGSASGDARLGHQIWLKNTGTTNNLIINNSAAVLVITLLPGGSCMLVAQAVASTWAILFNSASGSVETLQEAYAASVLASDDPKIIIDDTLPLTIGNAAADPANIVLAVTSTSAAVQHFAVSAASGTVGDTSLALLGAASSSTAVQQIRSGLNATSSADNSAVFSDGAQAVALATANQIVTSYEAGQMNIGGLTSAGASIPRLFPGISATAPNSLDRLFQVTTTGTTGVALNLLTGTGASVNRSVMGTLMLLGSTTTAGVTALGDSVSLLISYGAQKGLAASDWTYNGPITQQFGTASFATAAPDITFVTVSPATVTATITLTAGTTDVVNWMVKSSVMDYMV